MRTERFWATVWLFVFPVVLTAFSCTFLPQTPVTQLLLVPTWTAYTLLTRPTRQTLYPSLWTAILCEAMWDIPPGACITFVLLFWWLIRSYRDFLPLRPSPYHGLLCGVALLPTLHIWLWLYALLWPTVTDAGPLMPSLVTLILLPAVGALGGSAVFALAQRMEFLVFLPTPQEMREDER